MLKVGGAIAVPLASVVFVVIVVIRIWFLAHLSYAQGELL